MERKIELLDCYVEYVLWREKKVIKIHSWRVMHGIVLFI